MYPDKTEKRAKDYVFQAYSYAKHDYLRFLVYCQTFSERNSKQQFTLRKHVSLLYPKRQYRNAKEGFSRENVRKDALQKRMLEKQRHSLFHKLHRCHHFEVTRVLFSQLQHKY